MAVYTLVHKMELKELIKNYDFGQLLSFEGIQQGVENSNYKLITEKGPYILTIYEKRVNPKDLPYFINLMSFLFKKDIPCPEPIIDKKGEIFHKICNKNETPYTIETIPANVIDMYFDRFGKDVVQKIDYGSGTIRPNLWGLKKPPERKRKRKS